MGMFSSNRVASLEMYDVPTAEGYFGEVGANLALLESIQNDEKIFEAIIRHDFHEAVLVTEGASEEDIDVVQEASMGEAIQFLKDFFQKLLAKIKGIFESAIAKFQSIFMKDNKEFYKKYQELISQKNINKDWSKFKFNYAAPKHTDGIPKYNGGSGNLNANEYKYNPSVTVENEKDIDTSKWVLRCLAGKSSSGLDSVKEFPKWFHEQCYEEAVEKSDWSESSIDTAMQPLAKGNQIKDLKDSGNDLKTRIKKIISDIESTQNEVRKLQATPNKEKDRNEYDLSKVTKDFGAEGDARLQSKFKNAGAHATEKTKNNFQAWLRVAHSKASGEQKAITMYTQAAIKEAKFGYAQARRLTASVISFLNSKKSVREDFEEFDSFMMAVGEASDYEFDAEFESVEVPTVEDND